MSNRRRGKPQSDSATADGNSTFDINGTDFCDVQLTASGGTGDISVTFEVSLDETTYHPMYCEGNSTATISAAGSMIQKLAMGYGWFLKVLYTGVTAGGYTLTVDVFPFSKGDDKA